jgi:hypothetical protein
VTISQQYLYQKHIDTRYHFIRELVNNGEIYLEFCKSKDQLADIFTKPLARDVFEFHRHNLGVVNVEALSGSN